MNISTAPNSNPVAEEEADHHQQCCCSRLCNEFRLGLFDLRVSSCWKVDVPNSFAPTPKIPVLVIKFIIWVLTLSNIIVGWGVDNENPGFYLAYFTNWTLLVSFLYLFFSLINSTPSCKPGYDASCMIKLTWGLFAVAAHAQILVTLLFWLLVYDGGEILYTTLMGHGVVMIMVLMEGLLINRIPIRIKHFVFCCIYYLLYIVWSVIHAFTNIENPDADENDADKTSIYAALDWDEDPAGTLVTVVLAFGVASPILFIVLWSLSLYNPLVCRFDGSARQCIRLDAPPQHGSTHDHERKHMHDAEESESTGAEDY